MPKTISSTPSCIDLQERFGRRYRIAYEDSYYAQYGTRGRRSDPWLLEIVCRYGTICPHGGDLLAASIDGFPKVASRLRGLKCVQIHQDGDHGELTAVFNVADLAKVAKVIRPRSRRRLSDRQREVLTNRLRDLREVTSQVPTGGQFTDQESDPSRFGDSEHAEPQLALI